MDKLLTVKNKLNGVVIRIDRESFNQLRTKFDLCLVPKKLYKRQQRDLNRIRSKRKDRPFGSKLMERMAKEYGTKRA